MNVCPLFSYLRAFKNASYSRCMSLSAGICVQEQSVMKAKNDSIQEQ